MHKDKPTQNHSWTLKGTYLEGTHTHTQHANWTLVDTPISQSSSLFVIFSPGLLLHTLSPSLSLSHSHHHHHHHHHHHLVVGRQPEEGIKQEISLSPSLSQMMSGADHAVLCFLKHEGNDVPESVCNCFVRWLLWDIHFGLNKVFIFRTSGTQEVMDRRHKGQWMIIRNTEHYH